MTVERSPASRGARRILPLSGGAVATVASLIIILGVPAEGRAVALPLFALINIAIWSFVVLTMRDPGLPIFELGTLCTGFTLLYAGYPLFAFLMSGGVWTALSDNRLRQWNPGPAELGAFAWRYVVYMAAFAAAYLFVRGSGSATRTPMRTLSPAGTLMVVWTSLVLVTYFTALWVLLGVTYDPSYEDVRLGLVGVPRDLPHVVQQLSHNLKGILLLLKICGIALLMHRWERRWHRGILLVWLAVELVTTGMRMGARSDTLFLLVSAGLLYHRIVKPLTFPRVALAGTCLVLLALGYGFARDFRHARASGEPSSYWSAANEFQVIMSTGFDLHMRQRTGALDPVPWQVSASEALMLVPSQLLPFAKIDPAEWYLLQIGVDVRQAGLMFGVIGQAAIGYDWIELLVRGVLLGVLFAAIHRAYVRHARSFWWSILYLYVCLWSYYTIRASTFYFVYVVAYHFVPAMIATSIGTWLLRLAASRRLQSATLPGEN